MKKDKSYLIMLIGLLLAALVSLVYLSTFTRMHADDFCIAAAARQMDARSFFNYWYQGWTGRFIYIPLAGALALGGRDLAAWLPALTVFVWVLAIIWALMPWFRSKRWRQPKLLTGAYGSFFLLLLFSIIPNLFQSVFWKDGLINYSFPLVGLTISIGLLLRVWLEKDVHGISKLPMGLIFFMALISGGFSEIFSTVQIAFYMVWLLAAALLFENNNRRRMVPVFLTGLLGALLAYTIVLAAPGNQVRQDLISEQTGVMRLVTFTVRNALVIVGKIFLQNPGWAFLSISVSFVAGFALYDKSEVEQDKRTGFTWLWKHDWFRMGLLLPLGAFILTLAACAPVVYMLNAYPDDRSIIIPLFFIISAVMLSSGLFGYGLNKLGLGERIHGMLMRLGSGYPVILVLVLVASLLTMISVWQRAPDYRDYAFRWDQRHEELNARFGKGEKQVEVFGLENRFGISDLRVEADYWVNRCMADYYGFISITGK